MLGPAAHAAMGDRARPVPGMVIHGDVDPTVAPVNADQLLGQLMHANRLAAPGRPAHDPDRPSEVVAGQRRRRPCLHPLALDRRRTAPSCTSA